MRTNYIKEYRKIQGYKTIVGFARYAGVAETTLGEIERHKMVGNKETLSKIAVALGLSVEELYLPPR